MRITLAELAGHHHAIPGALESCRQQLHVKHHRYIAGIAANARAALYHPKGDMRITLAELRGNHAIAGAPESCKAAYISPLHHSCSYCTRRWQAIT